MQACVWRCACTRQAMQACAQFAAQACAPHQLAWPQPSWYACPRTAHVHSTRPRAGAPRTLRSCARQQGQSVRLFRTLNTLSLGPWRACLPSLMAAVVGTCAHTSAHVELPARHCRARWQHGHIEACGWAQKCPETHRTQHRVRGLRPDRHLLDPPCLTFRATRALAGHVLHLEHQLPGRCSRLLSCRAPCRSGRLLRRCRRVLQGGRLRCMHGPSAGGGRRRQPLGRRRAGRRSGGGGGGGRRGRSRACRAWLSQPRLRRACGRRGHW